MPKCKSCGAEIKWIETANGKNHPIDHDPKMVWVKGGFQGQQWILTQGFESHFATCPEGNEFRWREKA